MKISIVSDDKYQYELPENWDGAQMLAFMGINALVGEALIDLNRKIEQKVGSHEMYKYFGSTYVSGILVEIAGEPAGIVLDLDDTPQYVNFRPGLKIQEESKTPLSDAAEAGALG